MATNSSNFLVWIFLFLAIQLEAGKRKVLLIGIDGVRSDVLQIARTPNIDFIAENGFGTFESWHQDITISAPSWSSILCGVYHNKHGVLNNSFNGSRYDKYPMLCTLGKQVNPDLKFGMYMEWSKFRRVNESLGWDQIITGSLGRTEKTTTEAKEWVVSTDLDFYFVYLAAADLIGHILGFSQYNPFYVNAIENIDHSVGVLINALKERPQYMEEDWLILVTTDHGGQLLNHGGYSQAERQVFWFAYNDRIKQCLQIGVDMGNCNDISNPICFPVRPACPVQPDIAVTALHHLLYDQGWKPECNDAWSLDGYSWLSSMGLD
ncbi:MAG: alkaline phosphatase family protein, partial [Saprospiraceae bacterium]